MKRLLGRAACAAWVLLLLCACQAPPALTTHTSMEYLDTLSTVILPSPQSHLAAKVFLLCEAFDQRMNAHRPDSEIGRLNAGTGERVSISPDTESLLRLGQSFAIQTDGLLNICIGAVSLQWDFTTTSPALPAPEDLQDALAFVDGALLEIGDGWAQLPPGAAVDLGALAKGEALNQISAMLRQEGVVSALINLGGSVYALGNKPDGSPWRVAIQRPFAQQGGYLGVVEARDMCVVTAGIYERYFEKDGALYHHLLDPFCGYPKNTDLASATILYSDGAVADAYSTWCMLLGADAALALVESVEGMECILALREGGVLVSSGVGTEIAFHLEAP